MRESLLLWLLAFSFNGGVAQNCASYLERIDCHPGPFSQMDQTAECEAMGCIFCNTSGLSDDWNVPKCYLPQNYGYVMQGQPTITPNSFRVTLIRATSISMFGSDSATLNLEIFYQSDYRLRIKITDSTSRYEVPIRIDSAKPSTGNPLYHVEYSNEPVFSFKIIRN